MIVERYHSIRVGSLGADDGMKTDVLITALRQPVRVLHEREKVERGGRQLPLLLVIVMDIVGELLLLCAASSPGDVTVLQQPAVAVLLALL